MPKNPPLELVIPQPGRDPNSIARTIKSYVDRLAKEPITRNGHKKGPVAMYFVKIDIKRCVLDPSYQLPNRQRRNAGLARNWDMRKCEPIMVNFRDGKYLSVMNGVHRCRAAAANGVDILPAYLYIGLSKEDEIASFVQQGNTDIKVQPKEKFLALVAAGDPDVCFMNDLFKSYNFEVRADGRVRSPRYNIQNISAILEEVAILRENDEWKSWLTWTFTRINNAQWGCLRGCTGGNVIHALAAVYKKAINNGTLDISTANLDAVMSAYGPRHFEICAEYIMRNHDRNDKQGRFSSFYLNVAEGVIDLDQIDAYQNDFSARGLDKYLPEGAQNRKNAEGGEND